MLVGEGASFTVIGTSTVDYINASNGNSTQLLNTYNARVSKHACNGSCHLERCDSITSWESHREGPQRMPFCQFWTVLPISCFSIRLKDGIVITDVSFRSYLLSNFNIIASPGYQLPQIDVDFHFFLSVSSSV